MTPWRSIARPSRVRINDVLPGDTTVHFGRTLDVSAVIRADGDEPVPATLVYGSLDGRIHEQRLPLVASEKDGRHRVALRPDDEGIKSDLFYRIEAGDAATEKFSVVVLPAPTIVVEQIQYEFPSYTGMPTGVIRGDADIRALEGTRVTITARANEEIAEARIEFGNDDLSAASPGTRFDDLSSQAAPSVPMQMTDARSEYRRAAEGQFTLLLSDDRTAPRHTSYWLRFETPQQVPNENPVRYAIDVLRDLSPEVELLRPEKTGIGAPGQWTPGH